MLCLSSLSRATRDAARLSSWLSRRTQPARGYASPAPVKTAVVDVDAVLQQISEERKFDPTKLRTYKPRTPGMRHLRRPINDHLWKGRPHEPLTLAKKGLGQGGRNNSGQITVRHRGGGAKRRIRTVDFYRWSGGVHVVDRIEYDPNRSAHIALVSTRSSGRKSYIIAPEGLRAGDLVQSFRPGIPKSILDAMGGIMDEGLLAAKTCHPGNCLPIELIPVGTMVHNIGSHARGPAVFCRSAGTSAIIVAKGGAIKAVFSESKADGESDKDGTEDKTSLKSKLNSAEIKPGTVVVRLQSGEVRMVSRKACATIGSVSNPYHNRTQLGKAGRSRWLGIRPTVRGLAMNRVDHPHGGGRGKTKSRTHPTSPWGILAKGFKTRKKSYKNDFLVLGRPRGLGKRKSKAAADGKKTG